MNIKDFEQKLTNLNEAKEPEFGVMSAQHMVEHLTITVKLSSGRIAYPPFNPTEKQLAQKEALLFTEFEFPTGIKAPGLGNNLMPLKYETLSEAKSKLIKSLEEYDAYFKENPDARTIHPRFGLLTHKEWEQFHPKHFKHHFSQFNIW
jgi:oxepin-CoA hydrolase/3-oxo-5,6-dehydrosuberyl-CoA semialdehyde dehydrogenase